MRQKCKNNLSGRCGATKFGFGFSLCGWGLGCCRHPSNKYLCTHKSSLIHVATECFKFGSDTQITPSIFLALLFRFYLASWLSKRNKPGCTNMGHFAIPNRDSFYLNHVFNIATLLFLSVQTMWQELQAFIHPVHASAHPQRHPAISLPVLWQAFPPEVRHEEAHLHTHR